MCSVVCVEVAVTYCHCSATTLGYDPRYPFKRFDISKVIVRWYVLGFLFTKRYEVNYNAIRVLDNPLYSSFVGCILYVAYCT